MKTSGRSHDAEPDHTPPTSSRTSDTRSGWPRTGYHRVIRYRSIDGVH
jgi:hypothetical protein